LSVVLAPGSFVIGSWLPVRQLTDDADTVAAAPAKNMSQKRYYD